MQKKKYSGEVCLIPHQQVMLYAPVFHRGQLNLDLYAPRNKDFQQAHDHDELYFVLQGEGQCVNGGRRHGFAAGDAVFVPAGVNHRFEAFSDDFLTWVMFWGPPGGEADPPWPELAEPQRPWHWTAREARAAIDPQTAIPSALLFQHGSMTLKFYAPGGEDRQTPHRQDEIYIVHSGQGRLRGGDQELDLTPGNALFVAAGHEHRFIDCSDDFTVWVVFYGAAI